MFSFLILATAYADEQEELFSEFNKWLFQNEYNEFIKLEFAEGTGKCKGLKKFRDDVSDLLPPSIKIRISKDLKADWIAAPQLPNRRKEVMELAVKLGYYSTPRKCTQRDLANALGVRQGTIAEHLQSAESMIIQSWADQAK